MNTLIARIPESSIPKEASDVGDTAAEKAGLKAGDIQEAWQDKSLKLRQKGDMGH